MQGALMPVDVVCEDEDLIRPGDVYSYRCGNDQGYGCMVPVRTSMGWDFVDTYHLGTPWRKGGETGDEASVRQIIELGHGEHDGCVSRAVSNFYHKNAIFHCEDVPSRLTLLFNVSDYDIISRREARDFDDDDVVTFVPMYGEQHFDWGSGRTLGLCFVRKGAKKSPVAEFRALLREASGSIVEPYASDAATFLDRAEKKLRELEDLGLSAQEAEDAVSRLAKRIRVINKCREELREIDMGTDGY